MRTLLAAAAALTLIAGSALAQTPLDCGNGTRSTSMQSSTAGGGNSSNGAQSPGGSTCETVVMPNGTEHVTNGPAADSPGLSTSPHEGQGGGAGGGAAGGAGK